MNHERKFKARPKNKNCGDLKSGLVWILNGQKVICLLLVWILIGIWILEAIPFEICTNGIMLSKTILNLDTNVLILNYWIFPLQHLAPEPVAISWPHQILPKTHITSLTFKSPTNTTQHTHFQFYHANTTTRSVLAVYKSNWSYFITYSKLLWGSTRAKLLNVSRFQIYFQIRK